MNNKAYHIILSKKELDEIYKLVSIEHVFIQDHYALYDFEDLELYDKLLRKLAWVKRKCKRK